MNPAASPWIRDVTEEDFAAQVLERSKEKPVVVDFWAPWCGPCRALGPMLEKAVQQRGGEVALAKVNTDENQRLAAQFQIASIPTVIAFRDGRPINEFLGVLPEDELSSFLDSLAPSEAERLCAQAKEIESSAPAKAEELYRQALAKDEQLDRAAIGLARTLAAQGELTQAQEVLENVVVASDLGEELERIKGNIDLRLKASEFGDEDSLRRQVQQNEGDAELRLRLGIVLAAAGKYQQALDMLLSAAERDHKLATSHVRETMVAVFHLVGNQSDLANEYRRRLASLLY